MRKTMARPIALAVALAVLFIAGCSSGAKQSPQAPAQTGQAPAPTGPIPLEFLMRNEGRKYADGTDSTKNPWVEYMNKENNVQITWTLGPVGDEYQQKLNLTMASQDLPDLVYMPRAQDVSYYAEQGALQPLDDLIAQHAPNLKKAIPDAYWLGGKYQGKIYGIPNVPDILPLSSVVYIRQDWLDQLTLKVPKTLDELVAVMKAFKEAKLGGDATLGYTGMPINSNSFLLGVGWHMDPFVGAFGTMNGAWLLKDGKLVYGSVQPEMKEALAFLNRLYEENLIDPEFAVQQPQQYEEKIVSGRVGLYAGNWYDAVTTIATTLKNDPQARWVDISPPVGSGGKSGTSGSISVWGYNAIPVTSKNAKAVLEIMEWQTQEKVWETIRRGFEGQHWSIKDGTYTPDKELQQRDIYRLQHTFFNLAQPDMDYYAGRHPDLPGRIERLYRMERYINQFTGAPTPTMQKAWDDLLKLEYAVFTDIVLGRKPVSAFDEFVNDWKARGGEAIEKEVNDWYAANK